MKGSVAAMAFGFSGLSMAAICNNNCGRQVNGVNGKNPDFAARSSMCSAFVTTTVTYTPGATATPAPIYQRNVHGARDDAAPTITGALPAYATSCPDATAYWSACQCGTFGVSATTVTVTAATSTTTIVGSTCTEGLDYNAIALDTVRNVNVQNLPSDIQAPVKWNPQGSLINARIVWNYSAPALGFDSSATIGDYTAFDFTGYIHNTDASPKVYKLSYPVQADDAVGFWYGDSANSPSLSNVAGKVQTWYKYDTTKVYDVTVEPGFTKIRVIYEQITGGVGFELKLVDPTGQIVLGKDSIKNSQIVAGCTGAGAPVAHWLPSTYAAN